jgi:predicted metalloprotease
MANWDQITTRGNVEDRRGITGGTAILGGGLLGIIILLLNIFGGNNQTARLVGSVLTQVQQQTQVTSQKADSGAFKNDKFSTFAAEVLGSNNDTWRQFLTANKQTYTEPRLVLFRKATKSGCGVATSQAGPHYCPTDQTVYLDETFFEELTTRFGAKGGDVAQAYVIAHEVGHHVQNQLGILPKVDAAMAANKSQANQLSIKLELQADCFAGVWAHSVQASGVIKPGEINQALDAAAAVGDDRIQKSTEGTVTPETWTHGSSEQRVQWFNAGFNSGEPSKCNTF